MDDDLVVIIEDDADTGEMLRTALEEWIGVRAAVAGDGEEGLRLVQERRPSLILLDLLLPKIDGFEVARRLKGDPRTAAIPVIVMTALAPPEDDVLARGVGCEGCLYKPFELDALEATVRWHLLRSHRTRAR